MRPHSLRFATLARVLRGAVLGLSVLLMTIAGHTAGHGGSMPDEASILIMLPVATVK